ncbi:alkaline phosphatase D family protein [Kordiimonas sp.]|uniref:alkaline phosphatase D family protein n=1 Tax=Kordiimonas sp. TaxID=1970157 RepID=UPI003A9261C9
MSDFSRRQFMRTASMLGFAAFSAPLLATPAWITGKPRFISYPFTLGVASGDAMPTGFVIWTRLAPDPLDHRAVGPDPVPVAYEIAEDEAFTRVVQKGAVVAHAENAHAVHVDVVGLLPGRPYFYRFHAGDEVSPVGRARTTPAIMAPLERMKFAFCSCQNFTEGYFKAYRDMVAEDVELIVHLGDYIYEQSYGAAHRRVPVGNAVTLDDYRALHATYKLDPDLQAAHAHTSWLFTWDDHEVANDYAADQGQNFEDPIEFLRRRAAAYKAYYEHLPLRRAAAPIGADAALFGRTNYGNLLEINMLDTRQYRTDQPCQTPDEGGWQLIDGTCAERFEPTRSILGEAQEKWLMWGMGRAGAKWNVMAQGMLFSKHDYKPGDGELIGSEYWDGYVASRDRVLDMFEKRNVSNPVIIGGDVHATYVCDVKRDFDDPRSKTVASEFVATSITSGNSYWQRNMPSIPENPHIKLYEGRYRGYTLCDVTNDGWTADLRVVDDVTKPELDARTLKRFVIEDGVAGPQEA